jgi:hypothetical protein
MTDHMQSKIARERSPSFPVMPLKAALERLQQFEAKFGRHPAPYEKTGLAWGMEEGSSQANRYLAALKSFGLIDYNGTAKERTVAISESGRTYLRAQQESIKKEILKSAAMMPKQIAVFWPKWGTDRPPNEICLDDLVLKHGFTEASAPQFLKIYDETIAYASLSPFDKVPEVSDTSDDEEDAMPTTQTIAPAKPAVGAIAGLPLASGERVLKTGLLAKGASYKLIVSGHVGSREIERLIRQLELDKEILADPDEQLP